MHQSARDSDNDVSLAEERSFVVIRKSTLKRISIFHFTWRSLAALARGAETICTALNQFNSALCRLLFKCKGPYPSPRTCSFPPFFLHLSFLILTSLLRTQFTCTIQESLPHAPTHPPLPNIKVSVSFRWMPGSHSRAAQKGRALVSRMPGISFAALELVTFRGFLRLLQAAYSRHILHRRSVIGFDCY